MKFDYICERKLLKHKTIFMTFCIFVVLLILLCFEKENDPNSFLDSDSLKLDETGSEHVLPSGYLVWGPNCRIPRLDIFKGETMEMFEKQEYKLCSNMTPLTSIYHNKKNDAFHLILHRDNFKYYIVEGSDKLSCCFEIITRASQYYIPDHAVFITKCKSFSESFELATTTEYIVVYCYTTRNETVYKNAHAIVQKTPGIRDRLKKYEETANATRAPSVLMLGIDALSQMNIRRAMPVTAKHLHDNNWFDLLGYNKVGSGTYHNLMAVLTGCNEAMADNAINGSQFNLTECQFVWDKYRDNGYATAYAEDETSMTTFDLFSWGFDTQPTDYYMRTLMLQAEFTLNKTKKSRLIFCLGYQNYADFIYQYALDLGDLYQTEPHFGLFWTNTFSHSGFSDSSSMDVRMKFYLEELERLKILDNDIVIFFSDHGKKFHRSESVFTGFLEARLPFMFIWLPQWFKDQYPDFVEALKVNRNRLTSPFDLYATLIHILELSGRLSSSISRSPGCPGCHSLFETMAWNRSCDDAGIAVEFCTCDSYQVINKNKITVRRGVQFALNYMNRKMNAHKKGLCAKLTLKSIGEIKETVSEKKNTPYKVMMLVFEANPSNGKFECTVHYDTVTHNYRMYGTVRRLDRYGDQSHCVRHDQELRNYCYCLD